MGRSELFSTTDYSKKTDTEITEGHARKRIKQSNPP